MTRILATGDWHVGSGLEYGRTPQDRLADQEHAIEQIVDLAIEHDVDVLAIAGDVWHRRRPTPAELMVVARPLRRLRAEHTCDIVAICGNHCVETADGPIALDLFEDILDVYKRPAVAQTRAGTFAMLPWTPVSRLVAARDGGDRDRTHEAAAAMLAAAARGLRDEIPAGMPAVLMLHWSITGAVTPTGREVGPDFGVALPIEELDALGFDAVVAGHIHRHQFPGGPDSRVFYTGSPLPVDFGEQDTPHGCVIVTLGEEVFEGFEYEFVPLSSRPFVTVDVDLTTDRHEELGCDETDAVAAAIATRLPLDDAVVRIRYRATEEQARRVDWPRLRPLLEPAHRVYSVQADIVRGDRSRVDGMDEELAPLAALNAWCDANAIEERSPLHATTERYLHEVGT